MTLHEQNKKRQTRLVFILNLFISGDGGSASASASASSSRGGGPEDNLQLAAERVELLCHDQGRRDNRTSVAKLRIKTSSAFFIFLEDQA